MDLGIFDVISWETAERLACQGHILIEVFRGKEVIFSVAGGERAVASARLFVRTNPVRAVILSGDSIKKRYPGRREVLVDPDELVEA